MGEEGGTLLLTRVSRVLVGFWGAVLCFRGAAELVAGAAQGPSRQAACGGTAEPCRALLPCEGTSLPPCSARTAQGPMGSHQKPANKGTHQRGRGLELQGGKEEGMSTTGKHLPGILQHPCTERGEPAVGRKPSLKKSLGKTCQVAETPTSTTTPLHGMVFPASPSSCPPASLDPHFPLPQQQGHPKEEALSLCCDRGNHCSIQISSTWQDKQTSPLPQAE